MAIPHQHRFGARVRALATATVVALAVGPGVATPVYASTIELHLPVAHGSIVGLAHLPTQNWLSGHRGIDVAAVEGANVLSPGDGTVTFAGQVGGRNVVTVLHPSGMRSSVEPVDPSVAKGDVVRAGDVVGTVQAVPGHCAPAVCVHWGVRAGDRYLNPLDVLAGFGHVRLLAQE